MEVLIDVFAQKMRIKANSRFFSAGTQKFIKFTFNLSSDWNGLTVFAQFVQNGAGYNKYLDSNKSVYLPIEIVSGKCDMILYGSKNDVIATTNYLTLFINEDRLIYDSKSTDISKPLYDQLVNRVSTLNSRVNNFSALTESSTTADAELLDVRVGFNGKKYATAGEAVRKQMELLAKDVATVADMKQYFGI